MQPVHEPLPSEECLAQLQQRIAKAQAPPAEGLHFAALVAQGKLMALQHIAEGSPLSPEVCRMRRGASAMEGGGVQRGGGCVRGLCGGPVSRVVAGAGSGVIAKPRGGRGGGLGAPFPDPPPPLDGASVRECGPEAPDVTPTRPPRSVGMETSPAGLGLGQWWFAWLRVQRAAACGTSR